MQRRLAGWLIQQPEKNGERSCAVQLRRGISGMIQTGYATTCWVIQRTRQTSVRLTLRSWATGLEWCGHSLVLALQLNFLSTPTAKKRAKASKCFARCTA